MNDVDPANVIAAVFLHLTAEERLRAVLEALDIVKDVDAVDDECDADV